MPDNKEKIKYDAEGKPRKRLGDRNDGYRLHNVDSMHVIMPHIYPKRTDNEAMAHVEVTIDRLEEYLAKKSETSQYKYTFFHAVVAALGKVLVLRPKMNRFYEGRRYYQRYKNLISFTAKNKMTDDSHESLMNVNVPYTMESGESILELAHDIICKKVYAMREENAVDHATDTMDTLCKLPWWLLRFIIGTLRWMNFHGHYPKALQKDEPSCSSIYVSNLGSIKLSAEYHHLANWGTNSVFVVISEKKRVPVYNADGTFEMHDILPLGFTLDERIADGFYFGKSLRLFKYLLENPEELDKPVQEEVDFK